MSLDLAVSLVNTNNKDLLDGCLESLYKCGSGSYSMKVYLVDNASSDGSAEMVRTKYPDVDIVVNSEKKGFGANHNINLRRSKARYYLVLNEDTIILDNAIEEMLKFGDANPKSGIIGPKTINPDGTLQHTCAYEINFSRLLKNITTERSMDWNQGCLSDAEHDTPARVDWLRGSCLLVSDAALQEVGMLDERFFIFYEEVDWGYRMKKKGWDNQLCPQSKIIHIGKQAVRKQPVVQDPKKVNITMDSQMVLSQLLYMDKHFPGITAKTWRLITYVYTNLRLMKSRSQQDAYKKNYSAALFKHCLYLLSLSPQKLIEVGQTPGGLPR